MTMTPETFRDRFEAATDDPPPAAVSDVVAAGRQQLRRRRLSQGIAATVVAVVVGVGGLAWLGEPGPGPAHADRTDSAARPGHAREVEASATDHQLLDSCRAGNQGARLTELIFGTGTPTVESAVRTDQWELAIQSADGRLWADCFVHLQSAEFSSGMTVYDASGTSQGVSFGSGPGCGLVDGRADTHCPTWSVYGVDRLPAPVAAVRDDLGDHSSTTMDAVDGYVVLNHLGPLPGNASIESPAAAPPSHSRQSCGSPISTPRGNRSPRNCSTGPAPGRRGVRSPGSRC